ncbi:TetR/AcrR family transcriptional regulator [Aestuariirhabdus litorea]|uniref:TetR/AcrR family transcriptional regulator n=1 Tax=Aestuariirhabdus litorea TaxID=2528527 RepID=A0A3P3VLP6_9GAMM|nr:TetR/AcrR family transcriptional regulator [Aestuariirhabdus litorea]RRJ83682.1 TetR/AcrR family transcriptional regulator [Aestuariirhabdus litorea]RWW96904.1 TetR family transcriptional regulator [Endozoicomonadaceae bacterium GTF-13]
MSLEAITRKIPQQQRGFEKQRLILTVCEEIILEEDVNSLKMNNVAQRAGISIGSLYQYFPTKSAIVAALAEEVLGAYREVVQKLLDAVTTKKEFAQAIQAIIAKSVTYQKKNPLLVEVALGASADRLTRHLVAEDSKRGAAALAEVAKRVKIKGDDKTLARQSRLFERLIADAVRISASERGKAAKDTLEECATLILKEWGLNRYA